MMMISTNRGDKKRRKIVEKGTKYKKKEKYQQNSLEFVFHNKEKKKERNIVGVLCVCVSFSLLKREKTYMFLLREGSWFSGYVSVLVSFHVSIIHTPIAQQTK